MCTLCDKQFYTYNVINAKKSRLHARSPRPVHFSIVYANICYASTSIVFIFILVQYWFPPFHQPPPPPPRFHWSAHFVPTQRSIKKSLFCISLPCLGLEFAASASPCLENVRLCLTSALPRKCSPLPRLGLASRFLPRPQPRPRLFCRVRPIPVSGIGYRPILRVSAKYRYRGKKAGRYRYYKLPMFERLFSSAGHLYSDSRNWLSLEHAEMLLLIKYNFAEEKL